MPVGILGAGSWGWTLAHILARNNNSNKIIIWTRDEEVAKSINEQGVNLKGFEISQYITAKFMLQQI